MKTLILFYSRTGTTRKVAEKLAPTIGADIEEIFDTVDRSGVMGYLSAGRDASRKKLTTLKPLSHDLSDYDLIIVGTPIWAWTMSSPIMTLLTEQKGNIKQAAFFCTRGGKGDQKVFVDMAALLDKQPIAVFGLSTKDVVQNKFVEALEGFAARIK